MIFAALLEAESRHGEAVYSTMIVHGMHTREVEERALACWRSARPDLRLHRVSLCQGGVHQHLQGQRLRYAIRCSDDRQAAVDVPSYGRVPTASRT